MTFNRAEADQNALMVIRKIVAGRGKVAGRFAAAVQTKQAGPIGLVLNRESRDPSGKKTRVAALRLKKAFGNTKFIAFGEVTIAPNGILRFTARKTGLNLAQLKRVLWRQFLENSEDRAEAKKLGRMMRKAEFVLDDDGEPVSILDSDNTGESVLVIDTSGNPEMDRDFEDTDTVSALDEADLEKLGFDPVETKELMQARGELRRAIDRVTRSVREFDRSAIADALRSGRMGGALGGVDLRTFADAIEHDPKAALRQAVIWAAYVGEDEEERRLAAATDLRALLRDMIQAAGLTDDQRADALRRSLSTKRELLQYLVAGGNLEKLVMASGIPGLPKEILGAVHLVGGVPLPGMLGEGAAAAIGAMTPQERFTELKRVDDDVFDQMVDAVEEALESARFADSPEIQMMLDPERGFDLSKVPASFRDFLEIILTQYFDGLGPETKKAIFLDLLALPTDATTAEKLGAIINCGGPALHKAFQLVGSKVDSPALREVMAALKSQVKPFPTAQARQIIEASYGRPVDEVFVEFPDVPIAAASVGQVYIARIPASKVKSRPVVVKVLRPGIRETAQTEMQMLRELAGERGHVLKLLDRLEESLSAELDFRVELANLKQGAKVYNQWARGLKAVGLGPEELNGSEDVLVMEVAQGTTLDKVDDKFLLQKARGLADLTKHWLNEAMFGRGFFHGDLHAGNIFMRMVPRRERVVATRRVHTPMQESSGLLAEVILESALEYLEGDTVYVQIDKPYELTLIDFGSSDTLTKKHQGAILRMVVGLTGGFQDHVMKALREFTEGKQGRSTLTRKQGETMDAIVESILAMGLPPGEGMGRILNEAALAEVDLPTSFVAFHRGLSFLQLQMDEAERAYGELYPQATTKPPKFQDICKAVIMGHPGDLFMKYWNW